ncbi:MAG: hypothetical protein HQL47_11595 [Gammaproteobacteria bacterium]|nr:hypothetical protein [Gammaproteobacteria bacterium]
MKQSKLLGGLAVLSLLSLTSQSALAGPRHDHSASQRHGGHDQARVLRVKPIYVSVLTPVRSPGCGPANQHRQHQHGQYQRDKLAHNRVAISRATLSKPLRHGQSACNTPRYREEERLVGYQVKYRYKGKSHWTQTRRHPGDFIRIQSEWRIAHR